jgi:predicted KAP-like P-loop ATPase
MSSHDRIVEPYIGIASDIPQTDPDLDEFGYARFARLLATAALETRSPQGLVMGIHGSWGSGKSTLLNFIKYYLNTVQSGPTAQVIEFNPWWFDDRKQLASQFLAQFSKKLKLGPSKISRIGDLMAQYSGALGKAVAFSTGHAWLDVPIGGLLKLFKLKPKDIPTIKNEISLALQQVDARYIVIIDDIDRLTPDEIKEVFKVIKAVADFPNVIYLLSFDRSVVAKAISEPNRLDGEAYLEKIIQAPFTLPPVPQGKLHKKLFHDLDILIRASDNRLFDQAYWGNIFSSGIAPLLKKPRDIVRYTNILSVTYPALRNEVNITDFFALELIRLTLPQLYTIIRDNQKYFAGISDRGIRSREKEHAFHQHWADELDESIKDEVKSMLHRIFPRLTDMGHDSGFLNEFRKQRRAASPDVFPLYFSFSTAEDILSRSEILDFIEGLKEKDKTKEILRDALVYARPDGSNKAEDYLEVLRDFQKEITTEQAVGLIRAIAEIADYLILKSTSTGFFALPAAWNISSAIQNVIAAIPEVQRNSELLTAFTQSDNFEFLCSFIYWIKSAKEKNSTHGPAAAFNVISDTTIDALKHLATDRIREAAANGSLMFSAEPKRVLYAWVDWAAIGEPRQWALDTFTRASYLPRFLSIFISETHATTMGDAVGRINYSIDFKFLEKFVDLTLFETHISQLHEEELSGREAIALAAFRKSYTNFKLTGNTEVDEDDDHI